MHHLIYLSQAVRPFSEHELMTILSQARQQNQSRQITGALVYGNGQFMQVLEGEKTVITALYSRLLLDARHHSVQKLVDKPIVRRNFLSWSMAFQVLSPADFTRLEGYLAPEQLHECEPHPTLNAADTVLSDMMRELVLPFA